MLLFPEYHVMYEPSEHAQCLNFLKFLDETLHGMLASFPGLPLPLLSLLFLYNNADIFFLSSSKIDHE